MIKICHELAGGGEEGLGYHRPLVMHGVGYDTDSDIAFIAIGVAVDVAG